MTHYIPNIKRFIVYAFGNDGNVFLTVEVSAETKAKALDYAKWLTIAYKVFVTEWLAVQVD